jgi:hypothetical protein
MALRSVATTDTLGTFRTTFNTLATDVGDLSGLNTPSTSNLVDAINDAFGATFSFTLRDSTSTTQLISGNDILNVVGDSNILVTVSATDLLNVNLNSNITGLTSISATSISGTQIIGGTIKLISSTIKTTDSTPLNIQDIVNISSSGAITGVFNITGSGTANFITDVQVNSVSVATKPFAIAQAIALG